MKTVEQQQFLLGMCSYPL